MEVREAEGVLDGRDLRVGVALSTFNAEVTEGLLAGALEVLEQAGCREVTLVRVPGSFELPVVCRALAEEGCEAVVALGAVIKGQTDHYEHIAAQTAAGLSRVAVETGVPVAFGVLTARRADHALARSAPGPGNKGREAAEAAIRTADALRRLRSASPALG